MLLSDWSKSTPGNAAGQQQTIDIIGVIGAAAIPGRRAEPQTGVGVSPPSGGAGLYRRPRAATKPREEQVFAFQVTIPNASE
jgi:hypothetical protein